MMTYLVGGVFFVWLCILSWVVFKVRNHYFNLISRTKKARIDEILDELLTTDKKITFELEEVKRDLIEEIKKSQFHIQKIGLIRFNPFERIGGEQSFVIAFLDKENNGIIVNYIYTREGLRVYTKKVKSGKGEEYELSEEEQKAIKNSQ
ncbi:DUF4446 family protein, partial [Candidatus Roizmanbacteria bacterium]|nr:DUF4446 family protein [Candidatus Roizmanbacteria bacterium]